MVGQLRTTPNMTSRRRSPHRTFYCIVLAGVALALAFFIIARDHDRVQLVCVLALVSICLGLIYQTWSSSSCSMPDRSIALDQHHPPQPPPAINPLPTPLPPPPVYAAPTVQPQPVLHHQSVQIVQPWMGTLIAQLDQLIISAARDDHASPKFPTIRSFQRGLSRHAIYMQKRAADLVPQGAEFDANLLGSMSTQDLISVMLSAAIRLRHRFSIDDYNSMMNAYGRLRDRDNLETMEKCHEMLDILNEAFDMFEQEMFADMHWIYRQMCDAKHLSWKSRYEWFYNWTWYRSREVYEPVTLRLSSIQQYVRNLLGAVLSIWQIHHDIVSLM